MSELPRGQDRLVLSCVQATHYFLLSVVCESVRGPQEERPKKGEKEGKETMDKKRRGARPEAAGPQSGADRWPADPAPKSVIFIK